MLKEGEGVAKLNETEIRRACSVLCTAEYCVETIQQVRREKICRRKKNTTSFGMFSWKIK